MTFYLGTHMPGWLADSTVPLFVSRRRLARYKTVPRAAHPWALDSGGFTELSMHGEYQISSKTYAAEVSRYAEEVGQMRWAAIQDWMCEPFITSKTGLSVPIHQQKTVASYLRLTELAPNLPWLPVLQGFTRDDYMRCVDFYADEWVDLTKFPVVGLGSVCRRQNTKEVERIICELYWMGIKLHGFGFKIQGLERTSHMLESADSLAWSYQARRAEPLPGCSHKSCANCRIYAMQWRERVIGAIASAKQFAMAV